MMELRSDQIGNQSIELEKLQLRNIGTSENGLTPDEVGEEIAGQLMVSVQDAPKGALVKYLRKEAESSINSNYDLCLAEIKTESWEGVRYC